MGATAVSTVKITLRTVNRGVFERLIVPGGS
jgi:hypothetical protein